MRLTRPGRAWPWSLAPARGIGRATALALAGAGYRLALAARTEADLATVAGEIGAAGGGAMRRCRQT